MRFILSLLLLAASIFPDKVVARVCAEAGVSSPLSIPVSNDLGADDRQLNSGSYALVVGASDYQAWPSLPDVAYERKAVADELLRHGFHVRQICDPQRGPNDTLAEIRRFIREFGVGNNRLVIYLGGHGWAEPDLRKGYYVNVDSPKAGPQAREFGFSSIDMLDVAATFRGRHLLIVVNSCYSATMFTRQGGGSYPPVSVIDYEALSRPSRRFITAGERGAETPSPSPFAAAFVIGIAGGADLNHDGLVRGAELAVWLRDTVSRASRPSVPQSGYVPNPRSSHAPRDTFDDADYSSGDIVFRYTESHFIQTRKDIESDGSNNFLVAHRDLPDFSAGRPASSKTSLPDDYFVFFFEKDRDRSKIEQTLTDNNIPFLVKESILPSSGKINGLACHPDAPAGAIKTVARALIQNGVDIRIIDQATRQLDQRRKIIQVLQFKRVDETRRPDLRPLTLSDLDVLDKCPNDFVRQKGS